MSREIKFRGMDLQGRWFIGNLAILPKDLRSTGNKAGHYISNSAGAPFAYAVRPETVGQYTGLKDKNGREIYEGDVISYGGELPCTEAVDFREGAFGTVDHYLADISNIEVICNIYENPELLP